MANRSFAWTKQHASQRTKEYLRNLTFSISFSAHDKKVMLVHATPSKNNLYWFEERPEKFFWEMAARVDADVLIYGHTHKPYRKDIDNKVFINAGSVGRPKDGDPRTCVTIVEITPVEVKNEFVRVPYDFDKTASAIAASGLPLYFAEGLKKGK